MTATAVSAPPRATTNGKRRPVSMTVERHAIVGDLLDLQALAHEARDANGASLETVLRLPAGPWRQELQLAHSATHKALSTLLDRLRTASGRYDKPNNGA